MSGLLAVPFCQSTKRKKTVERTNSGGTGGGKHIRQFSSPIFPSVHSRTLNYVELVLADIPFDAAKVKYKQREHKHSLFLNFCDTSRGQIKFYLAKKPLWITLQ